MNIQKEEIIVCSKIGLYKSIQNYDGSSYFNNYLDIYIKSELYKLLTIYHKYKYQNNIYTDLNSFHSAEQDILEKLIIKSEFEDKFENKFNNILIGLSPFRKRIFYLKFNKDFTSIRSKKVIAELMCCSEETIRKEIQLIKQLIRQLIK